MKKRARERPNKHIKAIEKNEFKIGIGDEFLVDLGRELRPVIQPVEPILVELVCSGCMKSDYRPVVFVGKGIDDPYMNFDRLPEMFGWDKKSLRHIRDVFTSEKAIKIGIPSGFALCGTFQVVRLWRMWDNHG